MSNDSVPTPGELIEGAYLDAISTIAAAIGIDEPEFCEHKYEPGVELDSIPASVLNAGRAAMKYLAVGAGILDGQGGTEPLMDADQVLAMWTREPGE